MSLAEYKGVYVFAQQVDNEVSSIALELIGKGKDLAKDLDTLSEYYTVSYIQPVDMFPFTSLVECVVRLELKKQK